MLAVSYLTFIIIFGNDSLDVQCVAERGQPLVHRRANNFTPGANFVLDPPLALRCMR